MLASKLVYSAENSAGRIYPSLVTYEHKALTAAKLPYIEQRPLYLLIINVFFFYLENDGSFKQNFESVVTVELTNY